MKEAIASYHTTFSKPFQNYFSFRMKTLDYKRCCQPGATDARAECKTKHKQHRARHIDRYLASDAHDMMRTSTAIANSQHFRRPHNSSPAVRCQKKWTSTRFEEMKVR